MNNRKYKTNPEILLNQGKAIMSSNDESRFHFRVFAVNLVLSGFSASEIGKMAGVSKVAVTSWVKAVDEYGFDYLAAFPGCSEHTESSAKTIAELNKKVEQNSQKIIFNLELSNTKIAQTIAKSTKAKILTWHSAHNVTQKDFDSGKTYLDFMRENLANLGEALHDQPANK